MAEAATAETTQIQNWPPIFEEPQLTYSLPEMTFESQVRQQTAQLIISVLEKHAPVAEVESVEPVINSLYEATKLAAAGEEQAEKVIEINFRTDMVERSIKAGIVMPAIPLAPAANGKLIQHGQYLEKVQANSLEHASSHPIMHERVKAEANNAYRKQYLYEQGWFDDYSMVVFSRAEKLPEEGFFTDTMSCAIQLTSKADEGLEIEPAFVAGLKKPGAAQHDEGAIVKVGKMLGVDYAGMSPAEVIDTPVLVHNSLIPNGVVDIVKMIDECIGDTFFGKDEPKQDYVKFRDECHEIVRGFEPKVQKAKAELIEATPNIKSEVEATQRLHELSEKHMVQHAVENDFIDPGVFGPAAPHIEMARWHLELGNTEQAQAEVLQAEVVAQSNSCPGAGGRQDGKVEDNTSNTGDCEFMSKECPVCHKKNVWTTVTKYRIRGSCGCSKNK